MSMCDRLPKRNDGTKVTPWDKDWTNDVCRGIFEPRWGRVGMGEVPKVKIAVPEPVKTGEKVDPGFILMFVKGGYEIACMTAKRLIERR